MALPILPFVVGALAGAAATYLLQRGNGSAAAEHAAGADERVMPEADFEPVENTYDLEARAAAGERG